MVARETIGRRTINGLVDPRSDAGTASLRPDHTSVVSTATGDLLDHG